MTGRDERIRTEATALWCELFGEPPPIRAEGGEMLEILLRSMPEVGYEKIASPHLRRAGFTFARPQGARG